MRKGGTVKVFYHTATWDDLRPVDFPFSINAQAGVNGSVVARLASYPNPAKGSTNICFSIPSRAYASIKIYDMLGRAVRVISQGITDSGDHDIQVLATGLNPGDYTLELVVG